MNRHVPAPRTRWFDETSISLQDFIADVKKAESQTSCPLADDIQKNVPIYNASKIHGLINDQASIDQYMNEWTDVLLGGSGVVVFRGAFADTSIVDRTTDVLNGLIDEEKRVMGERGDHFGKVGQNARLWNAHEKLCVANPEAFIHYNAIDVVDLISRAWLGPLYQITTQVNVVYPGGKAQTAHRDYHMGFQSAEQLYQYPAHAHRLSAELTLQGAIAHCDMPIESGPTQLLPFSQRYLPGYLAILRPEFREYFLEHHIQLPLKKGDALFFNPALFHAAGNNVSKDIVRFANLMQIGSGYGRSIEVVDRVRMSVGLYPTLHSMVKAGKLSQRQIDLVIAATAEGYPFPANLDIDSPLSGMAPPSQQDLLKLALHENWTSEKVASEFDAYVKRRLTH
jgi:ectoine hydroxylase-related dioxygenase (phytanoyl-CoA dioxygenase family)